MKKKLKNKKNYSNKSKKTNEILVFIVNTIGSLGYACYDIKMHPSGNFNFKIKQFNSHYTFHFGGIDLCMSVNHKKTCYDFINIYDIPFISIRKNLYYGQWWGSDKLLGPYKTVNALLSKLTTKHIENWFKKLKPSMKVLLYRNKGVTWARLLNLGEDNLSDVLSVKLLKNQKPHLIEQRSLFKK